MNSADSPSQIEAKKIELLAPAGDMRAFRAALLAGADAIYLGLGSFNARRNAPNFSLEDLQAACRMAHLSDVRVYLTVNTLLLESEIPDALVLIRNAWNCGIDAVIVQDMGLLRLLRLNYPQLELHLSTQMNVNNSEGVLHARELGASRVTLARELSLCELSQLSKLGIELEVFGHGALCICHSGQCLMSSLIGRRSANRGLCAQPCRLPYRLLDAKGAPCNTPGEHLLSPKDLCTVDILPQLIEAGVASLKIEGRMKSPEYVSLVVSTYRDCLDRALADPAKYRASEAERNILSEAFSRGFSTAYLEGDNGNAIMSYQRPNNRGVHIGRVSAIKDGMVEITVDKPVLQGDILEFWTSRGRHTHVLRDFSSNGMGSLRAPAGARLRMVVDKPVAPGDRVFRVRSQELLGGVLEGLDDAPGRPCALDFQVVARIGKALFIRVMDAKGRAGEVFGDVVQAARTKAVSQEDIQEHVGRLGGTPYSVASWEIGLDEGVGMGFSVLHNLRRAALLAYEQGILEPWDKREPLPVCRAFQGRPAQGKASGRPAPRELEAAVVSGDPEVLHAAYLAGARLAYIPVMERLSWSDEQRKHVESFSELQRIDLMPISVHDNEIGLLLDALEPGSSMLAESMSLFYAGRDKGAQLEAGPRMGIMNSASVAQFKEMGARRIWLSPELSLKQIEELWQNQEGEAVPFSLCVFGRQELMVTEHCELMSLGECARHCASCPRRKQEHFLEDSKGYRFPVRTDIHGRGHVYNSVALDVLSAVGELAQSGVSRFIVDASLLTPIECAQAVARLLDAFEGSVERLPNTTTGHLFRGVL